MVKATSFCRAALKKSMYMPLTKPTMSPLTSCRRALPVLMRLNSMSMFTCLSSREVPRRTVCSAERDGGRSRIERDKATVRRMIELYCRRKLGLPGIVGEYAELGDYAMRRLERCRFGEGKPACKNCPVHCYSPARRTQIRRIMRWAGPRMLIYAPLEALRHLLSR